MFFSINKNWGLKKLSIVGFREIQALMIAEKYGRIMEAVWTQEKETDKEMYHI